MRIISVEKSAWGSFLLQGHGLVVRIGTLLTMIALLLPFVPCDAQAQQTQQPQTAPETSAPKVDLFGTNTSLESSQTDKGTSLGLVTPPAEEKTAPGAKPKKKKKKGEFAIAPIPMINPSIGNGGGAAVMYARKFGGEEDTSPSSSMGGGGFATGNGSWALGLGGKFNLRNDRYRITVGGGGGRFNYNFFGIGSDSGSAGISIPLTQRSKAFLIEPKIRIFPHWYLGPRYHLITNLIALNSTKLDPSNLPVPLPAEKSFQTAALGLRLQRDTSDNPFYPHTGSILDLTADFFGPAFGGDRNYRNMTLSYNKYLSAGKKNVFAIHGSMCAASDEAPFFDLCELGMSKDIRGYQVGQFRDNRMFVGQMEFRRELFWRIGGVAFAGAGAVGHTFTDFGSAEPGGGLGLRFLLAKRNHINLRFDYAWGDNAHAAYVSLGEAF